MNDNSRELKTILILKLGAWHLSGETMLLHTPPPVLFGLHPSTSPLHSQPWHPLRPSIFQVGPAAKAEGKKLQA